MPAQGYRRSKGRCLLYGIEYDHGQYFIERDGVMKKSMPDPVVGTLAPRDAKPELMLRMAIADIESLFGMDE